MRIAHVAPLFTSVPPMKYGGIERILYWLIEEQIKAGHDVTLFASGDSKTSAKLVPACPKALWNEEEKIDFPNVYHTIELDMLDKHIREHEFDIIHSHFNFIHYQSLHLINTPMITTLHWRVDLKEFQDLYKYFSDAPLIAISNSQKSFIPSANVIDVVHHGLPVQNYPVSETPEDYIVFVGRFSPVKGPHTAIEVARRAGVKIKIASHIPIEGTDPDFEIHYYNNVIKPLLNESFVDYLGELGEEDKNNLLSKALATVLPINWPEPFGLVFIESLLCGTPVITCPMGSAPELIKDGLVGFLAKDIDQMVDALHKIDKIDRKNCRIYAEKNFSTSTMAKNYELVYKKVYET
ncbi:MAG: glycosyltransferase family 4 protein [Pseudomonadota bacterium]